MQLVQLLLGHGAGAGPRRRNAAGMPLRFFPGLGKKLAPSAAAPLPENGTAVFGGPRG